MPFLIILAAWIFIVAVVTIVTASSKRVRRPPMSDDGHTMPPAQDLTCETQYGHNHSGPSQNKRYIVHEDPPTGYVILNGVKRKISDCKNL